MKKEWFIFIITLAFILGDARADVYLLGDSWLADTYNPRAVEEIGYYTGETIHPLAVNSMASSTLANDIYYYGIQNGDVAIIDIGLPDFFNGINANVVQSNLIKVVDYLASINVKILLSCPANSNSNADLNDKINRGVLLPSSVLCQSIKVRQPGHVRIIDLQSQIMAMRDFNYYVNDPVHLNIYGYTVFNIGLSNAIKNIQGRCNILSNQDLRNTLNSFTQLSHEQICTGLGIVENIWIQ